MIYFLRDPLFVGILLPLCAAVLFTGIIRLAGRTPQGVLCASAAIGAAFLLAYAVILGIPFFPPRSASHKIAYLVASGLVIGLVLDALRAHRLIVWTVLLAWPAVIIGWLAERQVGPVLVQMAGGTTSDQPSRTTLILLALFWGAGGLILGRMRLLRDRGIEAPVMLLVGALGLGLLALQAASSSLGLLGLALAAATAGFLLWNWPAPRYPFGNAAVLGAGTALLAIAAELGLFALSHIALLSLMLLVLVFFADRPMRHVPAGQRKDRYLRPIVLAATAAIPVLIALAFAGLVG